MSLKILFSADADTVKSFLGPIGDALSEKGLDCHMAEDHSPETVDYIVYAPNPGLTDFSPYTNTKAVLSLWAGVEGIVGNSTLTQPLTRMVDSGMSEGISEYVTCHVLRYHLGMDAFVKNPDHRWARAFLPLARNRRVGILGLGALGAACAKALSSLNFDVSGWSRRPKSIAGVRCLSDESGLAEILQTSEILVLLLPFTPATENVLNAERLAMLPTGAYIINPGRGSLIDDDALLASLNSGQIAHATLDVFRQEPLPTGHPYWLHPNVTVTPHIATETRTETASAVIAENIARSEAGTELLHLVDRDQGY